MRTGEILKKKKTANTTFVEGGNGGREGKGHGDSIHVPEHQ